MPERADTGRRRHRELRSGTEAPRRRWSSRTTFVVLVLGCLALAVGSISWAALRTQSQTARTTADQAGRALILQEGQTPPSIPTPRLIFQNVIRDNGYARVSQVSLDEPGGQRVVTPLTCERVYYAADRGLCLVPEHGLITSYHAIVFGPDFTERARVSLAGTPSRARISADGRYGAASVFVYGHSYADDNFSTETIIIDMASGEVVAELEQFATSRDGAEISDIDFNFWGVTFVPGDSNHFYATLRTGGATYLVEGDVESRSMRVLRENVECPSVSPDGTRVAFKKPVENGWRLSVLDLATMEETLLAEERSVDDQAEWLDDGRILYGYLGDIWMVAADGSATPQKFLADALSPAVVVRPPS